MAKQVEGNEQQKRKAARAAKEEGKKPSEVGATRGASGQIEKVRGGASHKERFETREQGKTGHAGEGKKEKKPHSAR
jgi:hypothetical protein